MEMPGRKFSAGVGYRYGFNGKELDDKDGVVQYDYGFRIYDPRLGRFKSVDPLSKEYPWYTPYQFSGNTPIQAVDLDGLEELHYTLKKEHGYYCVEFSYQSNTYGVDTKLWKAGQKIPEGEKHYILHYQDGYWGDMTWEFKSPTEMTQKAAQGLDALGYHREGKREAVQNMVNSFSFTMVSIPAVSPSYHKTKGKPAPAIKQTNSNDVQEFSSNINQAKPSLPTSTVNEPLVEHHIFNVFRGKSPASQKYRDFFKNLGINVNDHAILIPESLHKHLHRSGNNWTTKWKKWIDENPNATAKDAYQQAGKMLDEAGLNKQPIKKYKK